MVCYACKLCGKVFCNITIGEDILGNPVEISGRTLIKHHLLTVHGKKSLKKKYAKKLS